MKPLWLRGSPKNIKVICYHIPKTAGTSFRKALEKAYRKHRVQRIYDPALTKPLSQGQQVSFSVLSKVLIGHFQSNQAHLTTFPNAKLVTWLRDPVQRSWSHLHHALELEEHPIFFQYLKSHFLDKGIIHPEEMFLEMLKRPDSKQFFNVYTGFLKGVGLENIDFIGRTEAFEQELTRLSSILDIELENFNQNVREKENPPSIPTHLLKYFDEEYKYLDAAFK